MDDAGFVRGREGSASGCRTERLFEWQLATSQAGRECLPVQVLHDDEIRPVLPSTALAKLKAAVPSAQPTLENGDQVYVRDPDGVRVQFADVKYKR